MKRREFLRLAAILGGIAVIPKSWRVLNHDKDDYDAPGVKLYVDGVEVGDMEMFTFHATLGGETTLDVMLKEVPHLGPLGEWHSVALVMGNARIETRARSVKSLSEKGLGFYDFKPLGYYIEEA